MLSEIKSILDHIDLTQEKITQTFRAAHEFINQQPNNAQQFVDCWSKVIEKHHHKLALIYLANEVIQNTRNESVKPMFELVLTRGFTLAASNPGSIEGLKKVLQVWKDRGVYSASAIDEWEQICNNAGKHTAVRDRSSVIYVINLAKKLKEISRSEEPELTEKREDLVKEYVAAMKKMYHAHLNMTINLQRINEKITKVEEIIAKS